MSEQHDAVTVYRLKSLDGAEIPDLGSTILGLSGVAGLETNLDEHSVTVRYDPEYTDHKVIANAITGSGYCLLPDSGS